MRLPVAVLRPEAAALPLDRSEVMRFLGYKAGVTRLDARHEELVDRGIGLAVGAASPAASLAYCGITVGDDEVMTRIPGLVWRSRSLARVLKGAVGVSLVAATLGSDIEELTARLFQTEEYALATVVDAACTALTHGLSLYVRKHLAEQGYGATQLYGPGYGDWDIHDQIGLTIAAGGPQIGLTCTETCYLMPQKSLVGIVGWLAPGVGPRAAASGCQLCSMAHCAYRVR